jgi:hypothetical protein
VWLGIVEIVVKALETRPSYLIRERAREISLLAREGLV